MSNTLGVDINSLCDLASTGGGITISSMCTVFAESEVISLIGRGEKKEDIAYAVVDSIVSKVSSLCGKHSEGFNYFLTGGLSGNTYILSSLSEKLGQEVATNDLARYAGAIGAGLMAAKL
jgi:activator of 2-hydroxyglutaryl-CoA dehydratase